MGNQHAVPLISVIVPAYNAERTIENTCNSVIRQSHENFEIIIVNDGSKDGTAAVIERLAKENSRIKCIHQENGGVSKARNVGMDYAKGDYICFLDADDVLTEHCLSRLLSAVLDENADVAAGSYMKITEDGTETEISVLTEEACCVWSGKDSVRYALMDHPATHAVWGKLYRRDVLRGIRFEEGKCIHEDGYFFFEVCMQFPRMVIIKEPVICYYARSVGSFNLKWKDSFWDILYFAKRKYAVVEEKLPELIPLARNIMVKAALSLINSLRLIDDPRAVAAEKECTAIVRENAKYFIPSVKRDWIRFLIVYLGMQWIYKRVYRVQVKR